jgi:diacylglycerol kinase family enzyme
MLSNVLARTKAGKKKLDQVLMRIVMHAFERADAKEVAEIERADAKEVAELERADAKEVAELERADAKEAA